MPFSYEIYSLATKQCDARRFRCSQSQRINSQIGYCMIDIEYVTEKSSIPSTFNGWRVMRMYCHQSTRLWIRS